tara:strand:- start:1389 stop:2174 length:786 start_codon:yes stop_codon:yes gene_type:complete
MLRPKFTCIVQARTNSSRLPGKLLLPLGNMTVIQYLIERLKKSRRIDNFIVATTNKKSDNKICMISKNKNVQVFRGSEKNVLKRYYQCAKKYKSSIIIRVTADCPFIDVKYIDELINFYRKSKYDYIANVDINYLPDGFHCEIFNFKSLRKAFKYAKTNFDKEHVTSYIWKNRNLFKIKYYKGKKIKNFSNKIRLTLDYNEDYVLIKKIFDNLYKKNKYFTLEQILNFLKKNKNITNINKEYINLQWIKFHSKRSAKIHNK